jgi:hypothetical protein
MASLPIASSNENAQQVLHARPWRNIRIFVLGRSINPNCPALGGAGPAPDIALETLIRQLAACLDLA